MADKQCEQKKGLCLEQPEFLLLLNAPSVSITENSKDGGNAYVARLQPTSVRPHEPQKQDDNRFDLIMQY